MKPCMHVAGSEAEVYNVNVSRLCLSSVQEYLDGLTVITLIRFCLHRNTHCGPICSHALMVFCDEHRAEYNGKGKVILVCVPM